MIQDIFNVGILAAIVMLVFVSITSIVLFSTDHIKEVVALYRNKFTSNANVELVDMFVFTDPAKLFLLNVILMVIVPVIMHYLFQLWVITGSVLAVLLIMPGVIWATMRKKRLRKFEEQLPDAFMMIASSLQAGASLSMALETMTRQSTPPLSQEFGILTKRMRLGVPLEEGLLSMETRIPLQSFVMASSAIRISREVGGNLVDTISSMAKTLRRKKKMEDKIDSLTSQGRAQGMFMAALPIILAILLSFLEPEAMRKLYTTREGLAVLVVMVIMQVMGYIFIRKITTIDS